MVVVGVDLVGLRFVTICLYWGQFVGVNTFVRCQELVYIDERKEGYVVVFEAATKWINLKILGEELFNGGVFLGH